MKINIRKVTKTDLKYVLNLIQELAKFEKEPLAVAITLQELENDFNSHLFDCFIAENNQAEIIGMALFYNRYSTWKGKTIHLEDLIVTQQYRGKGVGKALLNLVINEAKKQKVRRVEWAVLNWNTPAIDFYKKVGAHILNDWYVVQLDEKGILNYN